MGEDFQGLNMNYCRVIFLVLLMVFCVVAAVPAEETEEAWILAVNELYDQEKYQEAIQYCDKILVTDPSNADAWYHKSRSLIALGYYDEGLECAEQAITIDQNYEFAWNNKGVAFDKLERYDEAIEAYDHAIAINPNYEYAWSNKASVLYKLERYNESLEAYNRAIAIDPNDSSVISMKGLLLAILGRYDESLEAYDRAIAIDPNDSFGWYGKGLSLDILERYDEAIEAYDHALEIDPSNADIWFNKGLALDNLERYDEAIEAYNHTLEIDQNNANVWHRKGFALFNLGRYDESLEAYDRAIEIDPNYAGFWYNKGGSLFSLGRYDESLEAYDRALEIDPTNAEAWSNKGVVLNKLGREEEANECFNKANEIKPDTSTTNKSSNRSDYDSYLAFIFGFGMFAILIIGLIISIRIIIRGYSKKAPNERLDSQIHKPINSGNDFSRDSQSGENTCQAKIKVTFNRTRFVRNKQTNFTITLENIGPERIWDIYINEDENFRINETQPLCLFPREIKEISATIKIPSELNYLNIWFNFSFSAKYGDDQTYADTQEIALSLTNLSDESQEFDHKTERPDLRHSMSETSNSFPIVLKKKYQSIEFIGSGGFARVYKGVRNGKVYAIKIPGSLDETTGKTFINEIQNWTRLIHPNIVRVHDYNILPVPYFEMDYCECSLGDLHLPVASDEAAWIIFNVCEGLRYAHGQSVIHRDIKPQNILLTSEGDIKITDWGLSRLVSSTSTTTSASFSPVYAAPEQITSKPKSEATDIWQVGVLFYELLTGNLPFGGESMVEIGMSIVQAEAEPEETPASGEETGDVKEKTE